MAALGAVALLGGCGGNSGPEDLSGRWEGNLSLRFANGGALGGDLTLRLDQPHSFVAGEAEWTPIGEVQSIAGPVNGVKVSLRMIFRCRRTFETTELTGTVSGNELTFTNAAGRACTLGGAPALVETGEASLTRKLDELPL
ncbi:MAG TPA: hypothetical protein VI078_17135 [bacterium]